MDATGEAQAHLGQTGPRTPARDDGYADLGDYAGIGDGRSVALVALDGSCDWWALPDLDGTPVFAALLDAPGGGAVRLAPVEPAEAQRRYVGDTNVLETVFTTASGSVRVTDALNTGVAGRLPWSELARRVEGVSGEVEMRWEVAPGSALGTRSPWARADERAPLLQVGDVTLGVVLRDAGEPVVGDRAVSGTFTAREGVRSLVAVVGTADEPLHLPEPEAVDLRVDRTVSGWQDWSDTFSWDGPFPQAVLRSALVLKLLLHSPTGAIAAAATTSLPEDPAGGKDWDYRYTWVRDTAYVLDAFVRCGLHEEVHATVSWLLATLRRSGGRLRPFYGLDGRTPGGSTERDVPGHRGVGPVLDGNDASTQLQLGPYGDLFQMVLLCVQESHVLDVGTQRLLSDLADRCCDDWQRPDAGMWELEDEEHYTVSKMSCWQALDRAAQLADAGAAARGRRALAPGGRPGARLGARALLVRAPAGVHDERGLGPAGRRRAARGPLRVRPRRADGGDRRGGAATSSAPALAVPLHRHARRRRAPSSRARSGRSRRSPSPGGASRRLRAHGRRARAGARGRAARRDGRPGDRRAASATSRRR